MHDLELLLRGGVVGVALLLALLFWRARPGTALAWTGALLLTGAAAYALWGLPQSPGWPFGVRVLLVGLAAPAPFFFWLLVRLVFEDGFRPRPVHAPWFLWMEVCGLSAMALRGVVPVEVTQLLTLGFRLPSLALIGHALWCLWRERSGDLVERRRTLRVAVLTVGGVVAALVVVAALLVRPAPDRAPPVRLAESALLLGLLAAAGASFATVHADLMPDEGEGRPRKAPPAPVPDLPDEDAAALARLDALMTGGEAWRNTGLTVGALAAQVGVPEYRLRRLINGRLGHRNFAAFLNAHRLEAAATRLADAAQARTPVLTIALDLGYGSIGPFNRAFRARFGTTPTEHRRAALGRTHSETIAED